MLAVAGEVADEVRPPGMGNPAVLQAVQQAVRRGEQLAGRRPGSVKMGAEVWTCLSEDSSLALTPMKSRAFMLWPARVDWKKLPLPSPNPL